MGEKGFGIDHNVLEFFAKEVKKVQTIRVLTVLPVTRWECLLQ